MRRRLVLSYLIVTAIILLLLEVPLGVVYARHEQDVASAGLEHDAAGLATLVEEGVEHPGSVDVAALANRYRVAVGRDVQIVARDGTVLVAPRTEVGEFASPAVRALIAQVETARGLENVETIAAVDGIDVIWIGQADLTTSLGIPGQYAHPTFQQAVERIAAACRTHNKTLGYLALDVEDGKAMLARGFRMLAYGGDLWLYQQALRAGIAAIHASRKEGTE